MLEKKLGSSPLSAFPQYHGLAEHSLPAAKAINGLVAKIRDASQRRDYDRIKRLSEYALKVASETPSLPPSFGAEVHFEQLVALRPRLHVKNAIELAREGIRLVDGSTNQFDLYSRAKLDSELGELLNLSRDLKGAEVTLRDAAACLNRITRSIANTRNHNFTDEHITDVNSFMGVNYYRLAALYANLTNLYKEGDELKTKAFDRATRYYRRASTVMVYVSGEGSAEAQEIELQLANLLASNDHLLGAHLEYHKAYLRCRVRYADTASASVAVREEMAEVLAKALVFHHRAKTEGKINDELPDEAKHLKALFESLDSCSASLASDWAYLQYCQARSEKKHALSMTHLLSSMRARLDDDNIQQTDAACLLFAAGKAAIESRTAEDGFFKVVRAFAASNNLAPAERHLILRKVADDLLFSDAVDGSKHSVSLYLQKRALHFAKMSEGSRSVNANELRYMCASNLFTLGQHEEALRMINKALDQYPQLGKSHDAFTIASLQLKRLILKLSDAEYETQSETINDLLERQKTRTDSLVEQRATAARQLGLAPLSEVKKSKHLVIELETASIEHRKDFCQTLRALVEIQMHEELFEDADLAAGNLLETEAELDLSDQSQLEVHALNIGLCAELYRERGLLGTATNYYRIFVERWADNLRINQPENYLTGLTRAVRAYAERIERIKSTRPQDIQRLKAYAISAYEDAEATFKEANMKTDQNRLERTEYLYQIMQVAGETKFAKRLEQRIQKLQRKLDGRDDGLASSGT